MSNCFGLCLVLLAWVTGQAFVSAAGFVEQGQSNGISDDLQYRKGLGYPICRVSIGDGPVTSMPIHFALTHLFRTAPGIQDLSVFTKSSNATSHFPAEVSVARVGDWKSAQQPLYPRNVAWLRCIGDEEPGKDSTPKWPGRLSCNVNQVQRGNKP